ADDVPWYGVGPSEPTPVPILGPDIIDPRQMDMIRRQAEAAARAQTEEPVYQLNAARDLPAFGAEQAAAVATKPKAAAAIDESVEIKSFSQVGMSADAIEALRVKRRENAIQRKAARKAKEG
ncbi:MAG: hypothetical protein KC546_22225, partial [Anaerolineae bacterium]|nr:hypothetical protein [Anaerolineae bacterium]